jgi:hypothetical protein
LGVVEEKLLPFGTHGFISSLLKMGIFGPYIVKKMQIAFFQSLAVPLENGGSRHTI